VEKKRKDVVEGEGMGVARFFGVGFFFKTEEGHD
jgi:hypothetical protein